MVYAFDGTTYTNFNSTTDANGQADFTLPQGSYRFRADYNGTQFWSDAQNDCTIPGCTGASITVTSSTVVTVLDTDGTPKAGLPIYVFNDTTYTGASGTTDTNGQADFTLAAGLLPLPGGSERNQFWSDVQNDCTIPGCDSITVTVTKLVTVTVTDTRRHGQSRIAGICLHW